MAVNYYEQVLIDQNAWSQYLEVGIGPDAEIFTKSQPMSAVGIGAGDLDDPDPRKDAGSGGTALGVRADQSVAFELVDHVPYLGAGRTGDAECPGDIAFAHGSGAFPDQPKDVVFGRD